MAKQGVHKNFDFPVPRGPNRNAERVGFCSNLAYIGANFTRKVAN